jgi:hypothetical protein
MSADQLSVPQITKRDSPSLFVRCWMAGVRRIE